MSGIIAYAGFIIAFSVITLTLYYGFKAVKFL